jgi:hypothetical protein
MTAAGLARILISDITDQIDLGIAHPGNRADPQLNLARHRFGDRAMRRGQGHRHIDATLVADIDTIDQPELVDIHRNLGVKNLFERGNHAFVDIPTRRAWCNTLRLFRQKAFEIIALALKLFGRRLSHIDAFLLEWRNGILDFGTRRHGHAFHFFDRKFGFFTTGLCH